MIDQERNQNDWHLLALFIAWNVLKLLAVVVLIIAAFMLSGCSAEKKCQKAITKATKLGCLRNDTITRLDTIRGFQIDTFVKYHNEVDTLTVDTGSIKSVTIIKWKTKEIYQQINKRDTVVERKTLVRTVYKTIEPPWWDRLLIGIIAGLLLSIMALIIAFRYWLYRKYK